MASDVIELGFLLQDPGFPELGANISLSKSEVSILGTGTSRFILRDADRGDTPVFDTLALDIDADHSIEAYLKKGFVDNRLFHYVNCLATCHDTLEVIEPEIGGRIRWLSGGPLVVRPHVKKEANAFYDFLSPSLNFGYFESPFLRSPAWGCLSHDVIAHELGHAILDSIRPYFSKTLTSDTAAFHESFGDLVAMFAALKHPEIVRHVFRSTGGNLTHPNILSNLAEQFGVGLDGTQAPYLRSAIGALKYNDNPFAEAHEKSTVLTGAVYEIVSRLVKTQGPQTETEFEGSIGNAVRWVRGMILRVLHWLPPTGVSLPAIARLIFAADAQVFPNDSKFRDIAKDVFLERQLWDTSIIFTAPSFGDTLQEAIENGTLTTWALNHAAELRLPFKSGGRPLDPIFRTIRRQVDHVVEDSGKRSTLTVEESYLQFIWESLTVAQDKNDGGKVKAFYAYQGSTLVLDASMKPICLSSDPPNIPAANPQGFVTGVQLLASVAQLRDYFSQAYPLSASQRAAGEKCGAPARPVASGTGAATLQWQNCNFFDHVQRISQLRSLPFARG